MVDARISGCLRRPDVRQRGQVPNAVQEVPPGLKLFSQTREVDSFLRRAEDFQFFQALLKQRPETGWIPPRVVMKSRSDLNKSVKEYFLFALNAQPRRVERFVGFEILLHVEQPNAILQNFFHCGRCGTDSRRQKATAFLDVIGFRTEKLTACSTAQPREMLPAPVPLRKPL